MSDANPGASIVPVRVQVLRVLEIMYNGKWWRLRDLAKACAMKEQTTRNALGDMIDYGWVEKSKPGNTDHFRLTDRALSRESQATINRINELLAAGAPLAEPEKETQPNREEWPSDLFYAVQVLKDDENFVVDNSVAYLTFDQAVKEAQLNNEDVHEEYKWKVAKYVTEEIFDAK